jgi:hypothetical protein
MQEFRRVQPLKIFLKDGYAQSVALVKTNLKLKIKKEDVYIEVVTCNLSR